MGFNMNTPDPDMIPAGNYLAEVAKVEEKTSRKGDAYWLVSWKRVEDGRFLTGDIWMVEGKGIPMTKRRLKFLGFSIEDGEIDPHALIGKRVFLAVFHDEWQGEVRLKVNAQAEDSCFGMYPEDAPPPNSEDVTSVPFDSIGQAPTLNADDNPF